MDKVIWLTTFGVLASKDSSRPVKELIPREWWQHCVIYQIYPRSFKDSDGDGVGDLNGIINELDHFVNLGVDAILMTPIFKSPMANSGYDTSDFYNIHEEYGVMEQFEDLLLRAHAVGLKVILEFVLNHASIESEYFTKSVAQDPEYADFFVWADGLPDPLDTYHSLPPSNWVNQYGRSAWKWNAARQQYYLHQFTCKEADFNFRNPAVIDEITNIMKFWLNKGVDGFKIDALPFLVEANPVDHVGQYPNDPLSEVPQIKPDQHGYTIPLYSKDLAESYDVVYGLREFIDVYNEEHEGDARILLTESYSNISMTMLYYGNDEGAVGAHFPFNFDLISMLSAESSARDFVYIILRWLTYMPDGGTPNWQFGNQDSSRMASRFRTDMVDGLNSLIMMLLGTAITYQGEEIGMKDGYVSWEDTIDPEACRRGDEDTYHLYSRDPAKTPYQWNNFTSAGFSISEKTWLPVGLDYDVVNLAKEKEDAKSHYKVYQALTKLRKKATLINGEYQIKALSSKVLCLVRHHSPYDTFVLIFNVGVKAVDNVNLKKIPHLTMPASVYVSSVQSQYVQGHTITSPQLSLSPGEAVILVTRDSNIK